MGVWLQPFMSAAKIHLKKLDVLAQALRICGGSFKPVSAMPVEIGEMPLRIRRIKLMLAYWVNLQGHCDTHHAKSVLKDCCMGTQCSQSFGWVGDAKAATVGLCQLQYSSTVSFSSIPPWLFPLPSVDLNIQLELKNNSRHCNSVSHSQELF